MEGVGARLGRSSTRYGPATVFTGPVRKWKKKWVHVSPSNSGSSNNNNNNHSQNHHSSNGTSNGNNGSHLVLFKWTPISQSQNNNDNDNNNGNNNSSKDDAVAAPEEPPRRKFKYIPIAVLEEQKTEAAENVDDEAKPSEIDPSAAEPTSRNDGFDEKPDINDVPMEESEEDNKIVRQDLNESTLDLSLGLTAHDCESDSKTNRNGQLGRVKSSRGGT
ncbi:hypothetical protein CRYUN_Cryun37aG0130400 [Craigia yunnanensis]